MLKTILLFPAFMVPSAAFVTSTINNTEVLPMQEEENNPIIKIVFENANASVNYRLHIPSGYPTSKESDTPNIDILKWSDANQSSKEEFIKNYPTVVVNLNTEIISQGVKGMDKRLNGNVTYNTADYFNSSKKMCI